MTTPLPPQDPREPGETLPGEAELAALYRQLPQNEPGPALDAAVLREAAQALAPDEETPTMRRERRKAERERGDWVHPKTNPSTTAASLPVAIGRKRPRWLIAVSSAATLVLAAGLAWHMRQPPLPESPSAATSSIASPEAAAAPRVAPARAAMPSGEAMPSPPPPEPPRQPAPRIVAARPALAPAVSRKAAANRSAEGELGAGYVNQQARSEPLAAPTMLQETAETPAAKAAAPAMPAPAPPAAPVAQVAEDAAAASDADTPARQLDNIRQLFAQHRDDEARQQLEAFHRIHPTWDLPPELRAQLRRP